MRRGYKKSKSHYPWAFVVAAAFVALGSIFYANHEFYMEFRMLAEQANSYSIPHPNRMGEARIIIEFPVKPRIFGTNLGNESLSLKDALKSVSISGDFRIIIQQGAVQKIASLAGKWKLYHNNELVRDPIEKLLIAGGDVYRLRQEP